MRRILFLLVLVLVSFPGEKFVLAQDGPRWENLCKGSANPYCVSVGKDAYNDDSVEIPLRGLKLGKIIGVVWIREGQTISSAGQTLRLATHNAYYYIIDNEITEPFVRECSEITVKHEGFGESPLKEGR